MSANQSKSIAELSKPLSMEEFAAFEQDKHPSIAAVVQPQDDWFIKGRFLYPANFGLWLKNNVPSGRRVYCTALACVADLEAMPASTSHAGSSTGQFMVIVGHLVKVPNPRMGQDIDNQGQPQLVWHVEVTIGNQLLVEIQGDWMTVSRIGGDMLEKWYRSVRSGKPHWVMTMDRREVLRQCRKIVEQECPFELWRMQTAFKSLLVEFFSACAPVLPDGEFPQWSMETKVNRIINGKVYEYLFLYSKMISKIRRDIITPEKLQQLYYQMREDIGLEIQAMTTTPTRAEQQEQRIEDIAYQYAGRIADAYIEYFTEHMDVCEPMHSDEYIQHVRDSARTIVSVIRKASPEKAQPIQDEFLALRLALQNKYRHIEFVSPEKVRMLLWLCSQNYTINRMLADENHLDLLHVENLAKVLRDRLAMETNGFQKGASADEIDVIAQ